MTFNEYARALKRAPKEYWNLPYGEVRTAMFAGTIVIAHGTLSPYQWYNKKWRKLEVNTCIDGHLTTKSISEFLKEGS